VSRRTLLWVGVLVLLAIVVLRLRGSSTPKPTATLDPSAIPAASAYARDVLSAARCGEAAKLAHSSLDDPCKTFRGIQGDRLRGRGHVLSGCDGVAGKLRNADRLAGADCVAFPLAGPRGRGTLHVWLRQGSGGWQVVGAASVVKRA